MTTIVINNVDDNMVERFKAFAQEQGIGINVYQEENPQLSNKNQQQDAWSVLRGYFDDVPPAQSELEELKIPDRKADMALEKPSVSFE